MSHFNNDSVQVFWHWFVTHEQRLRQIRDNLGSVRQELFTALSGFAVSFELALPDPKTIRLFLTANGNVENFPVILQLIATAPELSGWEFVAFRSRVPIDTIKKSSYNMDGLEVGINDLQFIPEINHTGLCINIFVESLTDNYPAMTYLALMLIDNLLGELDFVQKVERYEVAYMPQDPGTIALLRPISELVDYVDTFYSLSNN